ncbi:MAG: hypothetical protein E7176_05160 [Erysipelotrichaceae bacterium]|nr:hypothetical protein [Erysipelotrichaceae bacterium]
MGWKSKKDKKIINDKDITFKSNDNVTNEDSNEEAPKKEKRGVVKTFNLYKFIIKIVVFAILVTFGILMLVFKEQAVGTIYLLTGVIATFAAIIRIIPLLKTTKSKKARVISLVEICIHIVIGVYLIAVAFYHWNVIEENADLENLTGFAKFNLQAYRFFVVALFFTRVVSYFWVVVLHKEPTDDFKFWLHIIIMSLSILLAAIQLDPQKIVYTLVVLAFGSALVIGGEAAGGYWRYRKEVSATKEQKKDKIAPVEKEAPSKDDSVDINEIDPNIIPVEDIPQDSQIVS